MQILGLVESKNYWVVLENKKEEKIKKEFTLVLTSYAQCYWDL